MTTSLATLLAQAPRAPEYALPGPALKEDITALERELGFAIPQDLVSWLEECNGPCVGPGGLYGVGNVPEHLSIARYLSFYPQWKERRWIPIAGDGCGNYYLLVASHEFGSGFPIIFVEPMEAPDRPAYVAASGLRTFIVSLLHAEVSRSRWPFDETEVVAADPDILMVSGVALPWQL